MSARQFARCDSCDVKVLRWQGYIYECPPPPPDPLAGMFRSRTVITHRKMLLCDKCRDKTGSGSRIAALWWWLWQRN
jgi:hypothetical protein